MSSQSVNVSQGFAGGAPGVSLRQGSDPLLSIAAGATAVPVFIGVFRSLDGVLLHGLGCLYVQSAFDFNQRFGSSQRVVATLGDERPASVEVTVDMRLGSLSVQAYFDNGGGPCFILPVPLAPDPSPQLLTDAIGREPQITLICTTERSVRPDGSVAVDDTYAALGDLLARPGSPLLIADSPDGRQLPSSPARRTAVYYPALRSQYRARPRDEHIEVRNYSLGDAAAPGARVTLAQVKAHKLSDYNLISRAVDKRIAHQVPVVILKASPAVAGQYCQSDRQRGVWQAPAGAALNGVSGLEPAGAGALPDRRVNLLKAFPGEGVRVWGARTLVAAQTPQWLHINISRLFDAATRDITRAIRSAVFLPNNAVTWHAVGAAIEVYLHRLWRDGGLHGRTAGEAYYVQVGAGLSMSAEQIAAGLLIVHVGMAALRPLEFIDMVFHQQLTTG